MKRLLVTFALAAALQAAGNEHFQGTWKLDTAKSTQAPGQELKSLSIMFQGDRVTVKGETAKGEPINTSFDAPADGKEYPVSNAPYDHIIVKQVDGDHQLVTFKKDGKIQSVSHVELKGSTMTTKDVGTGPDGKKFKATSLFTKQ